MNIELLKRLVQAGSASGSEAAVTEIIKKEAEGYADEITTDAMGNLIVHKRGDGKKLMLAAHADEIGVMATCIDEKGFVRFAAIGGVYAKNAVHLRVSFNNGTIGVIGTEEDNKDRAIQKMYIDIGAKSRAEAEMLVKPGDTAVFCGETVLQNGRIISKALDNKIGCYALIETLKHTDTVNDTYFVFTVQEEVGLRGAKTAAFAIEPDYALAVDVTDTGDTPHGIDMAVSLGGGAAIKVMDRSVLCDVTVRSRLTELAERSGIKHQLEVMTDGGTDAGSISLSGSGVKTGGISVPCRYIHSVSEMAEVDDVHAVIELLTAFVNEKL